MAAFLPIGIMMYRVQDEGWAEVYPLLSADYATAVGNLNSINNARLALANADVQVTGFRVSDTSVKGDSYPVSLDQVTGTFAGTPNTSAPAYEAWKLRLWGGPATRSHRFIRALPAGLVTGGFFIPSDPWNANLATYRGLLTTLTAIAQKIKDAVAPPFFTFVPVTTTTIDGQHKRNVGRPFGLPVGRALIA